MKATVQEIITRESIIMELTKRGYSVEPFDAEKNGKKRKGIIFKMGGQEKCLIIYTDIIIPGMVSRGHGKKDIASIVAMLYEQAKEPQIDLSGVTERGYIEKHIRLFMQQETEGDAPKRPSGFEGIECRLIVMDDERSISFLVKKELLDAAGIDEEEAWKMAESNTFAETEIFKYKDIIEEVQMLIDEAIEEGDEEVEEALEHLFIVSNRAKFKGAANILDKRAIRELAERENIWQWIAIPSSIHEFIIMPNNDGNMNELDELIKEVNDNVVEYGETLSDRAYFIDVKENEE